MSHPLVPTAAERAAPALAVPLAAALGLSLLDESAPEHGVHFVVSALAGNGVGGAHAAALSAAMELAAYLAVLPELAPDEHAVTHASAVQLIVVAPVGERVEATARLLRRSRRLAFLEVEATCDGHIVALGQLTKSVVTVRPT
ncbi:hotdog domain-containing protein [Lapillicoccus sp.]|uniref:thioesterase, FlK family n=1 Tax=Lapillicoccus sp. TaxID=1909287 RepID=UPI0025E4569D|nr:hotdog domain-containing protein [Lapillicoccus sp.]